MLLNEAVTDVKAAAKLMKQAHSMLETRTTREGMITAAALYAQAGQLFEKAGNIFRMLGPAYATKDDLAQCELLKNECLETLKKIKGTGQK